MKKNYNCSVMCNGFVWMCTASRGNYGTQHQVKSCEAPSLSCRRVRSAAQKGTGVVKGELFGVTRGGDVKIGAGQSITLRPLTHTLKHTEDRFPDTRTRTYRQTHFLPMTESSTLTPKVNLNLITCRRAEYSVFGMFSWYAGYMPQLVFLNKDITVKNGETVQVQP